MKKIIGIAMSLVLFCAAATVMAKEMEKAPAAAPAENEYVVQSVSGNVQYEVSPDKWKKLTKGTKLAPSTVVKTNLNSALVVLQGGEKISIKAMQKNTIEKLCSAVASAKQGGVKMGSKVATSEVDANATKSRTSVSTASSRASTAEEDVNFENSGN